MTATLQSPDAYGVLTEPTTLTMQRLLPGPIERVWAYLTDSDLRRQWLAAGPMPLQPDSAFELTWRHNELTDPPGQRPAGFGEEHRMQSRIIEANAPHKLEFTWGESAEVSFQLQAHGSQVLLTLVHSRVTERAMLLNVSAGWHAHLDVLQARLGDEVPAPFWDRWSGLKGEYERRLAG